MENALFETYMVLSGAFFVLLPCEYLNIQLFLLYYRQLHN